MPARARADALAGCDAHSAPILFAMWEHPESPPELAVRASTRPPGKR
jgi:hypothetical protein